MPLPNVQDVLYKQSGVKQLHIACSNAYRFLYYILKKVSVCHHQTNYFIKTFNGLIENNLCVFVQYCAMCIFS